MMVRLALAFAVLLGGCTEPDGADDDDDDIGGDGDADSDADADADLSHLPCSARSEREDGQVWLREFTYDAEGRLEIERIWSDFPVDGEWDDVRLETHSYGEHGVDTESHDHGADCLSEYSFQYDHRHRRLPEGPDLTFDERGNVVRSIGEHRACTYQYDDHDNLVLQDCEGEVAIEDTPDWAPFHETVAWMWTYDAGGHEVALDVDHGDHGDEHWRWTWNEIGQRIREEYWQDNRTGDPEIFEWTYDGEGRLATEVFEGGYGGRRETTFAYDCWQTGGPDAAAVGCGAFRVSVGEYADVSLVDVNGCGLRTDGTLACWGFIDLPAPEGSFFGVASGMWQACALLEGEGTIECFVLRSDREEPPWAPPPGTFVAIEADVDHGCGLREDGSIACWGEDHEGSTNPPDGVFAALDVGRLTACALDAEGYATCWGANLGGQRDVPRDEPFRQIAIGYAHGCGITLDGALRCWGQPVATDDGVYTQVAVGGPGIDLPTTCAIREDSTVACWGELSAEPDGRFTDIDLAERAACALREDRRLVCWGNNDLGATSPP